MPSEQYSYPIWEGKAKALPFPAPQECHMVLGICLFCTKHFTNAFTVLTSYGSSPYGYPHWDNRKDTVSTSPQFHQRKVSQTSELSSLSPNHRQNHRNVLYMFQEMSPGFRLQTGMLTGHSVRSDLRQELQLSEHTSLLLLKNERCHDLG